MKTEYVITADIGGITYFLRIQETGTGRHLSYQGLVQNATRYDDLVAAGRDKIKITSEWQLAIVSVPALPNTYLKAI